MSRIVRIKPNGKIVVLREVTLKPRRVNLFIEDDNPCEYCNYNHNCRIKDLRDRLNECFND